MDQTVAQLATLQANVVQAQTDVTEIKGDVKTIKQGLDTVIINQTKMDSIFVTQSQYTADKNRNWVANSISALFGAILAGLVALVVALLSNGGKL
jgi:hypothetical protein